MSRALVVLAALLAVLAWISPARAADPRSAQRLVAVLEYVASDYPAAVAAQSKTELDEQRAFLAEAIDLAKGLEGGASFVPRLESLAARVAKGDDPAAVQKECAALAADVVQATGLVRSPRHPPDLARGREVYEARCASCHGSDGAAKTKIAETLDPKPVSFREGPRIAGLAPSRVFDATTFGVKGTAMVPVELDDADRWAVAFYVLSIRHGACNGSPPNVSLARLATASDDDLAKEHGDAAVACLRTKLPTLDVEGSLLSAKSHVQEAMRLAKTGDAAGARRAVLDAYLTGVEPIEPLLRSRDPALVARIEEAFLALRLAIEKGERDVGREGDRVLTLLETARRSGSKSQARSVFGLALLILLREGFEVTVVLGALLAVLKKAGARRHVGVVHAGWIAALIVGALVFVFARKWVAGSNREWLEGVVALLAVVMLLYAAFWINARSNTRKFMGELREKMKGALDHEDDKGSGRVAVGLFAISFSSMLRESVETALFLQGLAIDSVKATAWGAIAGVVLLVAIVLGMGRFGLKLPMKLLFDVSTLLLFATAVVLLGKGIHALQEVGLFPLRPIPMFRLDVLGVYPDAWSLGAQVLLLAAPFAFRLRRGSAEADAQSTA